MSIVFRADIARPTVHVVGQRRFVFIFCPRKLFVVKRFEKFRQTERIARQFASTLLGQISAALPHLSRIRQRNFIKLSFNSIVFSSMFHHISKIFLYNILCSRAVSFYEINGYTKCKLLHEM